MDDTELDVLVVGAGPAGLTAALLLTRAGHRVRCVTKHAEVAPFPRARGIHARAAEILRDLGLYDAMWAERVGIEPRMEVRSDLAAAPLGGVPTGGETFAPVSPCEGIPISQDVFETVLRRALDERAPGTLQIHREVVAIDPSPEGERARVRHRDDGRESTLAARYLIGADGWRSVARTQLGIGLRGPDDLGRQRGITFRADLSPWLGEPPAALHRLISSGAVLLRTHDDHRWALGLPAADAVGDPATVVRTVLGVDPGAVEVIADWEWTAAAQTAERFSGGRVFLIGDAAHRVPPAGGTGVSAAMADASDLAWKLDGVLSGWAGPALLDSYDVERRPVAERAATVCQDLWHGFLGGAPLRVDLRVLDMGYVYDSAATLGATPPAAPPESYVPQAVPGARAPHAWLPDGRSTLDLFGGGFALLTADVPAGTSWCDAVLACTGPVPVTAHALPDLAAVAYALGPGAAVLVRPDGHVAWRCEELPADPAATLADLLHRLVARAGEVTAGLR